MYLFSGGGPSYASALFGAAKVKECSPDQGIAIPLEEFHHYNSQKEGDPLFIIAPAWNHRFARARDTAFGGQALGKGQIYSIVNRGARRCLDPHSDVVLRLPAMPESLASLWSIFRSGAALRLPCVAMAKFRQAE